MYFTFTFYVKVNMTLKGDSDSNVFGNQLRNFILQIFSYRHEKVINANFVYLQNKAICNSAIAVAL